MSAPELKSAAKRLRKKAGEFRALFGEDCVRKVLSSAAGGAKRAGSFLNSVAKKVFKTIKAAVIIVFQYTIVFYKFGLKEYLLRLKSASPHYLRSFKDFCGQIYLKFLLWLKPFSLRFLKVAEKFYLRYKKGVIISSGVLIYAVFVLFALPETYAAPHYKNVLKENAAVNSCIDYLNGKGFLQYYGGNISAPESSVTIAEFTAMVCRMTGMDDTSIEAEGHWADADMEYAVFMNWFSRAEVPKSAYDKPIARELAARIAIRAFFPDMAAQGIENGKIKIADQSFIDKKNLHYVQLAYSIGLIEGYPDGTFRPKDKLSLADASLMLCSAWFRDYKEAFGSSSVSVPILMYHNLTDESGATSPEKFRKDMESLKAAGYTTIFYSDLYDYVENGKALPQKPVIVSFDDGYYSNYQYAYPVLKQLGMKAEISIIGNLVGVKNKQGVIPHFNWSEAQEMYDSGAVRIEPHSYEMHEYNPTGEVSRRGILKKNDEDYGNYISAFVGDNEKITSIIEQNMGYTPLAYTYPSGFSTSLSEKVLEAMGYRITVTTKEGLNNIVKGDLSSLTKLKRITADGLKTDIVNLLSNYGSK